MPTTTIPRPPKSLAARWATAYAKAESLPPLDADLVIFELATDTWAVYSVSRNHWYGITGSATRCDCTAGYYDGPCYHVAQLRRWLGLPRPEEAEGC